jgi:hypothetical protein
VARKVSLVLATIIDLAVAALLIDISGFIFGRGPESMRAGALFGLVYFGAILACVAAPVVGFKLNGSGRPDAAQAIAWLPAVIAFAVMVIPAL